MILLSGGLDCSRLLQVALQRSPMLFLLTGSRQGCCRSFCIGCIYMAHSATSRVLSPELDFFDSPAVSRSRFSRRVSGPARIFAAWESR